MTALLIILTLILIAIIVVQIGKVTELASKIRGEEEMQDIVNRRHSALLLLFMIVFLVAVSITGYQYKNYFLGFGPQESASAHGGSIDNMFQVTLFFTGVVFFITQALLFYFAYKYKGQKGRRAAFISHNNNLEIIWTAIPAVVMAFLVISGLDAWNEVMADVEPDEEFIEVEATGYQFAWHLRYPGEDGKLGEKDYRNISGLNPLGQNWEDKKNLDDFHPSELVLPVGKKVRVRITSRDVLHNFYLPHFRVKMDAVPGMPTYFVFTPTKTTEEYRQQLKDEPEYQEPVDPTDPESPQLWEEFNFELACAELCGKGHYSMQRDVRIVTQEEYEAWKADQSSYYFSTIRGSDEDPYKDQLFEQEVEERRQEFSDRLNEVMDDDESEDRLTFNNVSFETGSAELAPISQYELNFLAETMEQNADMRVEIAGHTDDTGEEETNQELSEARARVVVDYLVEQGISEDRLRAVGYGSSRPIADNADEAGRQENRRTEFRIL